MANYEVPASSLIPFMPKGVELVYYDGKTYVSLVGFLFKDTSIFNVPIPFFGTFEEVNLRFYVKRKIGNQTKRGVVFINETVPNKLVALVANKLYNEHYIAIPTKHKWSHNSSERELEYQWRFKGKWNSIKVVASLDKHPMDLGSMEEFIFEHYYGFTKLNSQVSMEYKINHPRWEIYNVYNYSIECDFKAFYGKEFEQLGFSKPHSVMLAEGSEVNVDWKRTQF